MSALATKREAKGLRPRFEMEPFGMLKLGMDDLLEQVFGHPAGKVSTELANVPKMDVSETETSVEVHTDVPGMKPEEIDIEIRDGALTIRGTHTEETKKDENGRRYHRVERRTGSFVRSIWLPCAVDESKVDAELVNGVLTIRMPKAEAARTNKVSIKTPGSA